MQGQNPMQALGEQSPNNRRLTAGLFRDAGAVSASSPGEESTIISYKAKVPFDIRGDKPFRVAIPAHETVTEDGAAGTETVALSYSVIDPPATAAAVAFEGGNRIAVENVDTAANEVDVASNGSGNEIDVFFISDAQATLRVKKEAPPSSGSVSRTLYDTDLLLPHSAPQFEDGETIETPRKAEGLLPTNFRFVVTIDADYPVRLDPITRTNGDAVADNALVSVPVRQGTDEVKGLATYVATQMVQ